MTWPRVPLGELFTIARGGSPRPIDAFITDDPDGVNWIMIGDATEGAKYISSTKKRIRREGVSRSRTVKPGDFLLTNSMSFGHPYILNTTGCIHDGWLVLSPRDDNVNQDYFYHLLGSPLVYAEFERLAAGAVVKNLNSELVRGVKVPFPPLAQQRRIADILDKADAVRRKRKEAIVLTEELLRSAFLEMFGDPVTNPKGWRMKPLGDLLDAIDSGWSPVCEARAAKDYEWGVLKLGAVTFGRYDGHENKALPADLAPAPKLEVRAGDVLFSRKNTYEHVAACVFVANTRPKLMLPDLIFRLVLSKTSRLRPETLWALLSNERMRKKVQGLAGGTAGSMPNISKERLKTVNLPVPPIALQERFAGAMRGSESIRAALEAAARESEVLFDSMVARAFSGGLS